MKKIACIFLLTIGIVASAQAVQVGNAFVRREIQIQDGIFHTLAIHNLTARKSIPVRGDEFALSIEGYPLLTSADFHAVSSSETAIATEGEWELLFDRYPFSLRIQFQSDPTGPYLRKTIQLTNRSGKTCVLRWLDVENIYADGEAVEYSANPSFPALTDYGQPVLLNSLWFGLEHPAANSAVSASGAIVLRHHPGITLQPGESFESFPAILGVSSPGAARQAFEEYVLQLKYYAGAPRVFFWWNGFRVIKPPDRLSQGRKMVECMLEKLQKPYGQVFDAFSYDAGFDMYKPEGLWVPREDSLWDETYRLLKDSPTKLGFWASFSCIFDTTTHVWGKTQRFGLQHPTAYCLAEPTYHEAAKKRLLDIVQKYDIGVISFDGMYPGQGYGCNTPGHGHYVSEGEDAGKYGTEAVVNAEMDIFHVLRKIQPELCLDFFICGEWVSPWWLTVIDGVHSVPGDTIGAPIISPSLRDELITARNMQAFELHRKQRRPFPLWAEDLYGFQVRKDHLIDNVKAVNEDYAEKWENEYVLGFAGRGTITSYIACSDLLLLDKTPSGMKFLADVAHWVRRNRDIYLHTQFILGDPSQGEVCGYSHGNRDNRSLIAIHNPDIQTRSVSLKIDEQLDLASSKLEYQVNIIYPYRASLGQFAWNSDIAFSILGYEVVLLDIRRSDLSNPVFPSVKNMERSAPTIRSATAFLQEKKLCFDASFEIPVDRNRPELWLYLRPDKKIEYSAKVDVNGKQITPVIRSRTRPGREEAWFQIPASIGANQVQITLAAGSSNQFGAWLRSDAVSPNKDEIPESQEPLFPILPSGSRYQYWPAHPISTLKSETK